jgi:hypothetical protein
MTFLSLDERKLLGQRIRNELRTLHYGMRTETSYVAWIKRYLIFHDWQEPSSLTEAHINDFLTYLAVVRYVAESSQTQALSAIIFMYKKVLGSDLETLGSSLVMRRGFSNNRKHYYFPNYIEPSGLHHAPDYS